jgi:hypothetical protein
MKKTSTKKLKKTLSRAMSKEITTPDSAAKKKGPLARTSSLRN